MNNVHIIENWRPNRSTLDPSSMIQIDKNSKKIRIFFEAFPFDCYMVFARDKYQHDNVLELSFSFMTDVGDRVIKFRRFAKEHIPDEWWEQETLPEISFPWNIIYEMEGETREEIIQKLDDLIVEIKKVIGRVYDNFYNRWYAGKAGWDLVLSRNEFIETIYKEIKKRLNPPLELHPIRSSEESAKSSSEEIVPKKSLLCPKCNKTLESNFDRCPYCGTIMYMAYLFINAKDVKKHGQELFKKLSELGEAFALQGIYDFIVKVKADSQGKLKEVVRFIERLPYISDVIPMWVWDPNNKIKDSCCIS